MEDLRHRFSLPRPRRAWVRGGSRDSSLEVVLSVAVRACRVAHAVRVEVPRPRLGADHGRAASAPSFLPVGLCREEGRQGRQGRR